MGSLSTPGTLKILVIGADDLDRIVTVGTQQPYYIIECGKQRSRSKPCLNNGTAPHWNTAHKFELLDETAAVAVIKDEMTKGIIAEGLIDLSRARLSGRDAATAQLRNLAGQPAGRLRFKLKFVAAGAPAAAGGDAGRLAPAQQQQHQQQHLMGAAERQYSHDAAASSLPYSSRRVSEAGSYRSTNSIDGRRSGTPPGSLPYVTASLERGPSGGLRASPQHSMVGRRQSGDEPDIVLAAANSKVSMAKQAMQQLTAELAELTGPGGQQQQPSAASSLAGAAGQQLLQQQGSLRGSGLSPSPVGSGAGSMQPSAFAVPAAQQPSDSRSSSRQGGGGGGVGLNVLGQPVQQQQQQQQQQQMGGQRDAAWGEYKHLWQQQRQQQHQQFARPGAAPLGPAESWNTVGGGGQDAPMPVYQQQQYDPYHQHHHHQQQHPQQHFGRLSTGSVTPSGGYTPTGMLSPAHQLSPQGSAAMPGGAVGWGPRLRGVFGDGVLSTEELVALYADSGAGSEKKLISLLEDALAAAHAEKVATEQELANVKQAMAEVSKQHYLDTKRLKEMTASAAAASAGAAHAAGAGRSVTPPPRFRYGADGTPPASPLGAGGGGGGAVSGGGGMFSMVDTKPSRRHSRASDSAELRDLSPLPRGLTVATGRQPAATAAVSRSASTASAGAAAGGMDAAAAAVAAAEHAELTKLRAEHSRLQAASAALDDEVARLKAQVQRTQDLEKEVDRLKEQQAKDSKAAAAAAAAGAAAAGGAVAAAAAAAELDALRDEHARVRALAEDLEDEVSQLRNVAQQLQDTQQQLEDLQSDHASVKAAFGTTQQQLEKLRQQQLDSRSVKSGSEFQDAAEDFESGSSNGGSPMPAYKLQIQVHQLERQLVEQVGKTQDENTKREKLAAELEALQERLDEQIAAAKQAEDNARAAEKKAAEQATIAAAARAEVAEVRAHTESSSGLSSELAGVRDNLDTALAEKAELEAALGLLDRNSKAQIEQLQAELVKAHEEAASLREGSGDVATLQAQLAAAQQEASGHQDNSEEVEYLQAQLRRTLRQVVELQRQVQLLQQERSSEASASNPDQEAALEAAIRAETDFLMQELVAAKLELAEVKEQQLITQRQLFKARESMKEQSAAATAANS